MDLLGGGTDTREGKRDTEGEPSIQVREHWKECKLVYFLT